MNIQAWRYYSQFYKGAYRRLFLTIVASIGQSFLHLPILLLVRHAFDDVIPSGNSYLLVLIGATIVLLYLLTGGISLYTRYVILRTTKFAIQRFRDEMLKKFYALSRTYYSQVDLGKLHTTMVQDTERLDVMTNALVAQVIPALFTSAALSAVLMYLNWLLFLVMLGIMALLLVMSRSIGKMVRRRVHAFHRSFETFSTGMLFVLQMMDLTRIQSAEHFEMDRQRKNLEELRLTSGQMAWLRAAYGIVQNTIVVSSGVAILMVGGGAVATGHMTLGELLSFYVAVPWLRARLSTISSCIPQIIEGNESLATLFGLLETTDSRPYSGTKRIAFRGGIALQSVHFRYNEHPVLHDVSLAIHPNTRVAIVGPNGAGKSTIVNLVLGFYRPQKGQLYADHHPFSELDIVHLRRHIGVVTQDAILFPGTILENISYGHADVSTEQIVQASELATAHEFIQQLPEGYDTFVGERGVLLSGGQRQRIAIARALLGQPRLLVLDEPTAHLDETSVRQLMHNLEGLDTTPAIVMISHDMGIAHEAQHVYLLQEGRIVASGHPLTLLQQKPLGVTR